MPQSEVAMQQSGASVSRRGVAMQRNWASMRRGGIAMPRSGAAVPQGEAAMPRSVDLPEAWQLWPAGVSDGGDSAGSSGYPRGPQGWRGDARPLPVFGPKD